MTMPGWNLKNMDLQCQTVGRATGREKYRTIERKRVDTTMCRCDLCREKMYFAFACVVDFQEGTSEKS